MSEPEEIIAWLNSPASDEWRLRNVEHVKHSHGAFATIKWDHHCVVAISNGYCGPEDHIEYGKRIEHEIRTFGMNGIDPLSLRPLSS
jgi:hypothetical protein